MTARWSPPRWAVWLAAVAGAITATVAALGPIRGGVGWLAQPAVAAEVQAQVLPLRQLLGVLICNQAGGLPYLADCVLRAPDGRIHRVPLGDAEALLAVVTAPPAESTRTKGAVDVAAAGPLGPGHGRRVPVLESVATEEDEGPAPAAPLDAAAPPAVP